MNTIAKPKKPKQPRVLTGAPPEPKFLERIIVKDGGKRGRA